MEELQRKGREDARFRPSVDVLARLAGSRYLDVLDDDPGNSALATATQRISQAPIKKRLRHARDLGEIMVLAHACVLIERGVNVVVLIDDGQARRLATREVRRNRKLRGTQRALGDLQLVGTIEVLSLAIGSQDIPDPHHMQLIYNQMRKLDDGLVEISATGLLSHRRWAAGR